MSLVVFLVQIVALSFEIALTSYVAVRAWHARPARWFVRTMSTLVIMGALSLGRTVASAPWEHELIDDMSVLMQGFFLTGLVMMLAALFTPEWWEGRRPIRWIILPYLLTSVAVAADLLLNLGIFVSGRRVAGSGGGASPFVVTAIGELTLTWYVLGTVVAVIMLVVSFVRVPGSRRVIGVLALSLSATLGAIFIGAALGLPNAIYGLVIVVLVLGGLAYAVLSTDLLVPVRLASEQALRAMHDAVVVVDDAGLVLFCNPAAMALGVAERRPILATLRSQGVPAVDLAAISAASGDGRTVERRLCLGERQLELMVAPIADGGGHRRGTLVLGRDITESIQHSCELEAERERLATAVRDLETREHERDELAATVRGLALPVIPVSEGVLVLPLVGDFDTLRAEDLVDVLLQAIERERARLVLIDITGVPLLDTAGAAALLRVTQAAALLGARCTLVGVRPEIAQTLVTLGVSFANLEVAATLQQGLRHILMPRRA